jgi:hypothetical protein
MDDLQKNTQNGQPQTDVGGANGYFQNEQQPNPQPINSSSSFFQTPSVNVSGNIPTQQPKNNKKKTIILVVVFAIGLFLLIIIGIFVYKQFFSNSKTSENSANNSAISSSSSQSNSSSNSNEIFTWDGTVVTGLTEKGKNEETLNIPDNATAIGEDAFQFTKAKNVTIGKNVEEIGKMAFYTCKNLSEISIPSSVKKIDDDAFYLCQNLSSITFSSGLEEIGETAFFGTSAKSITLPEGLKTLKDRAFDACPDTEEIYLPASLENIPFGALGFDYNTKVYVKSGSWSDLHFEDYVPDYYKAITGELEFIKAYY